MLIGFGSGTTGMPKGCPFNIDRGFMAGISVWISFPCQETWGMFTEL